MKNQPPWPKIIVFDGICILCNRTVDFIIRKDDKGKFKFASLQAAGSTDWLPDELIGGQPDESVILLENGKVYRKSSAVLKILGSLPFPLNLAVVFQIIPHKILDLVYDHIARHRYKWFGKRQACRVPDENTKGRLIA